jgi:uncharacterized cupredoxin-like copper-binding protein
MTATRLPVALLVAGAVALAGCGDDDDSGAAAESSPPADTSTQSASTQVKVSETEFKIAPAKLTVEQAGTTTFEVVNDGKFDHSLEVEGPSGEVETDTIAPGESATLEVDLGKPGTYEMYCPIGNHREMGMDGEVSVAGGGGAADDDGGGSGKGGY